MELVRLLTSTADSVEAISLWVSIVVIILMALAFAGMFLLYYKYFGKSIDHALEDEDITKDIVREYRPYFAEAEKKFEGDREEELPSFEQYRKKKDKRTKGFKVFGNTCLICFYCVFIALMSISIYIRSSGELFDIGGTSYLVVLTPSMEEKNPVNTYLEDIDDQLPTFTLIAVNRLSEEVQPELYDICVFRDDSGDFIIHRLISITTDPGSGRSLYTFRGDANSASATYETNLTIDDIVAVYADWQNFGLGVGINYLRSSIGIICVSFALVLVGFYDLLDIFLGNKIKRRKAYIHAEMEATLERHYDEKLVFPFGKYLRKPSL